MVALLRGGKLLSWGTGEQGQLGRVGARLPERGLKELLLAPAEISLKRTAKGSSRRSHCGHCSRQLQPHLG